MPQNGRDEAYETRKCVFLTEQDKGSFPFPDKKSGSSKKGGIVSGGKVHVTERLIGGSFEKALYQGNDTHYQ